MLDESEVLSDPSWVQLNLYQAALLGFRVPTKATHAVLVLVILSIIVPALIFAIASYYSYLSRIRGARERLTHTVEVVRENAFHSLESIHSVAKEVDSVLDGLTKEQISADQEGLHLRLKNIRTLVEKIEDITITNRDGIPIVSAAIFPLPKGVDLSDRDYYRAHRDNLVKPGAAFVSEVLRGRVRRRIFFAFSWARKNERGSFAGVIAVSAEPNSFSQFFAAFLNKGASAIALIRDDGAVLARSPGRQEDLLGLKIAPNILEEIRKNPGGGHFQAPLNVDGGTAPYLIAYEKVPGFSIYVVAKFDKNGIVAAWKEEWLKTLSFGVPLMLGLLGFGAVAYHVTRTRDEVQQRFRQFAEHSSAAIWTMNAAAMRFDYLSPASETIWGMGRQEVMDHPRRWGRRLHPEDRHRVLRAMAQLRAGRFYTIEYRIVDPLTGAIKWIKDIGFPIANGRIGGIAADVTERRLTEDRIRLLSQEVSHRAKNLLAVVQSMVRQTAPEADPAAFAEAFSQRIEGLAASLDLLVNSGWQGVDLGKLVTSQLAPFVELNGNRVSVSGPPLIIRPAAAQTLGMALHELATNSVKYGALSSTLGRVSIEWSLKKEGDDRYFHMSWRESEGPAPKAPIHQGFGYTVLVSVVEYSLKARVQIQYPKAGLVWELIAPLEEVVNGQGGLASRSS